MNQLRRKLLQGSASALLVPLLGTGLLIPGRVLAAEWNQNAFSARNANDALKAYGAAAAIESREITISAPEIAENGAKVEVEITSNLPGIESITLIGEKNTLPLIAVFNLSNGAQG